MMPVITYIAIVALMAAAYLDRNFWRVLTYAVLIGIVIVYVNVQTEPLQALSSAVFSVVLFPVLMYVTIGKTRHEDEKIRLPNLAVLLSLPVLYILLTFFGFGDSVPLYLVFLFPLVCLSTIRNVVRLMFFVYMLENSIMILSESIVAGTFTDGIESVLLVDSVAFLPVALMAYLTVRLYKDKRSLDIWQIW